MIASSLQNVLCLACKTQLASGFHELFLGVVVSCLLQGKFSNLIKYFRFYLWQSMQLQSHTSVTLFTYMIYYTPTHREGAILQSPCPSIRQSVRPFTFVTYISASTGRNDCTYTSCLPCDLQMNEWGYSQHDVACNILLFCKLVLVMIIAEILLT